MFSMKLWMGLSLLVVSALAAPPVRVNGDKSVETPLAQDIRRFDGVVAIEPKPTSRNGIKSILSSLWGRLDSIFDKPSIDNFAREYLRLSFINDNSLTKRSNDELLPVIPEEKRPAVDLNSFPERAVDNTEPAPTFPDQILDEVLAQLYDPIFESKNSIIKNRGKRESIWLQSLKSLEENEEALNMAKIVIDKVENFFTEKMHSNERSLVGYVVKKMIEGDNEMARQNNPLVGMILEKIKHGLVAHFLNGDRKTDDGPNEDVSTAVASSVLYTAFNLLSSILRGVLSNAGN